MNFSVDFPFDLVAVVIGFGTVCTDPVVTAVGEGVGFGIVASVLNAVELGMMGFPSRTLDNPSYIIPIYITTLSVAVRSELEFNFFRVRRISLRKFLQNLQGVRRVIILGRMGPRQILSGIMS